MCGANENGCACRSGCLACLTAAWGFVKMIACCRCRSPERFNSLERPAESDPEENGSGVASDYETATPPPTPRQAARARGFRSVVDVFQFMLPPLERLRRRSRAESPIVERDGEYIVEEKAQDRAHAGILATKM